MSYLDCSIKEIHEALVNKKITVYELVSESLERARNDKNNAFEVILKDEALKKAKELDDKGIDKDKILYGIPYAVKDNLSTKDIETTGSSNILKGYVPIFDATVIKYLNNEGAILIGKTTLDELAMGGSGTTGHKGITYNPYNKEHDRLMGGSSCGSASVVASGIVPFALGSDTGDSVRKPASYGGLVGFKPTWGLISRFGLFPFATSMDHVAYFTKNVEDSSILLNYLSKKDEMDFTNTSKVRPNYSLLAKKINNKKIAYVKEIVESIKDKEIINKYEKSLEFLKQAGAIVEEVNIDINLLKSIFPVYFILSCAEATSNNSNLDGIKFGVNFGGETYKEVMFNARNKGFSPMIKRRFIIGSYSLMKENQYELFIRAQKARKLIVEAFNDVFKKYDAIYMPATPTIAPKINEEEDKLSSTYLIADNYLAYGNLGGFPSITIPLGFKDNLPFGGNITCKPYNEVEVFNIASCLEEYLGYRNLTINTYKENK